MRNIFPGLILFFSIQNVFAQTDQINSGPDETFMAIMRKGMMGIEYKNPFYNYKGSQFYNDWTSGEIFLTNGEKITGLSLRYEGYLDQLLWLREDQIPCILCKTCINGFNLFDGSGNITASFLIKKGIRLPLESDSADCFFQSLVQGEYSFYALRKVGKLSDLYELTDDTRYFIFKNDQYERIRLRVRDLLNFSSIDKTRMKSIIRSNKIRLRNNEQEFIRAIVIYNR
ncbi:MAG: hypothetical protein V1903_02740 [Bacteroidota bacterium]